MYVVIETEFKTAPATQITDMTGSQFQRSPGETVFVDIRPQGCFQGVITLVVFIKMGIVTLSGDIAIIIEFTLFIPRGQTKHQSRRNIFRTPEIIDQIGLIILHFDVSKSGKIIPPVIIQMVGIVCNQRTIIEKGRKKTTRQKHILVIAIPVRQQKRFT